MLKVKNVKDTVVSLEFADCADDGGKYALICNLHSYLIQDNNKARLWTQADCVADWCEGCAGTDPRLQRELVSA